MPAPQSAVDTDCESLLLVVFKQLDDGLMHDSLPNELERLASPLICGYSSAGRLLHSALSAGIRGRWCPASMPNTRGEKSA